MIKIKTISKSIKNKLMADIFFSVSDFTFMDVMKSQ